MFSKLNNWPFLIFCFTFTSAISWLLFGLYVKSELLTFQQAFHLSFIPSLACCCTIVPCIKKMNKEINDNLITNQYSNINDEESRAHDSETNIVKNKNDVKNRLTFTNEGTPLLFSANDQRLASKKPYVIKKSTSFKEDYSSDETKVITI